MISGEIKWARPLGNPSIATQTGVTDPMTTDRCFSLVSLFFSGCAIIISLPAGCVSYRELFASPDVRLYGEDRLVVAYEPTSRSVTLATAFGVTNHGQRDEVMMSVSGTLEGVDPGSNALIPLAANAFVCDSQGQPFPFPFRVGHETLPSGVRCAINVPLGGLTGPLFAIPGQRRLTIAFEGEEGTRYTLKHCFTFSPGVIEDFLGSSSDVVKRDFLYTLCPQ